MTKSTPAPDAVRLVPVEPDPALMSVIAALVRRMAISNDAEPVYFDNGHARRIYQAVIDAAAPAPATARGGDALRIAVEALEAVAAIEPKPFAGGLDMAAIRACEECQRYEGHPVQHGICNTHRRPIWDREKHDSHEEKTLGYRAKSIARDALAALASQPQATGGAVEREAFGDALLAFLFRHGLKIALEASEIEELRQKSIATQPAPSTGEAEMHGEVTDEWADRFCEAVNWSPDGQECKTVEGQMRCVSFRDLAKGYILSAIATQPAPSTGGEMSAGERAFTAWAGSSKADATPLMWTWDEMPKSQQQRWHGIAAAASLPAAPSIQKEKQND